MGTLGSHSLLGTGEACLAACRCTCMVQRAGAQNTRTVSSNRRKPASLRHVDSRSQQECLSCHLHNVSYTIRSLLPGVLTLANPTSENYLNVYLFPNAVKNLFPCLSAPGNSLNRLFSSSVLDHLFFLADFQNVFIHYDKAYLN